MNGLRPLADDGWGASFQPLLGIGWNRYVMGEF